MKVIFKFMPVFFGALFLGPVVAEILTRSSFIDWLGRQTGQLDVDHIILGLSLTQLCMMLGAIWGLTAVLRGRWI